MCTNYAAARRDQLFRHFGIEPPDSQWRDEVYKDYPAPIIRRATAGTHADVATFGMAPRKHIPPGVRVFDTMNARAETVGEKRSFRGAWKRQQLCLVPYDAFTSRTTRAAKPFAGASTWRATSRLPSRASKNPRGTLNIHVASVEKYKAEIDAARRAYLDSQTEEEDPPNHRLPNQN